MSVWIWTLGSVVVVSLVSFVGLVFLGRGGLDRVVLYLVSLAAGVLLGGAFFHLLPEAWEIHGNSLAVPLWFLAGFLGFFFLERFLWAHHHGHGREPLPGRDPHGTSAPLPVLPGLLRGDGGDGPSSREDAHHGQPEDHEGSAAGPAVAGSGPAGGTAAASGGAAPHRLRPVVVMSLMGDGLHNLIDGMIIAAAYTSDLGLGLITTGAVLLHEVPQEAGEFGVLVRGGLSVRRALLFNFLSASLAVVGALVALSAGSGFDGFTAALIPLTAGNFVYIAAADLIPELHHRHDAPESAGHATLLVVGVLLTLGLRLLRQ